MHNNYVGIPIIDSMIFRTQ